MQKLRSLDPRVLTILLIVFVQMVGASMAVPVLPLYAQRQFALPEEYITLLLTAFFAAQFVAGPTIGSLSDRFGRVPVLIISQIGTVIAFVMIAAAQSTSTLFYARILDGITGGNIIVAQAYITDVMPREKRTEAIGLIFAAFGIGFIVGPALGGILAAWFGARAPFALAAVAALITVILTWRTLNESLSPEERAANRQNKGRGDLKLGTISRNFPLLIILVIAFVGQFAFGLLQGTFALFGEAVIFEDFAADMVNLGIGLLLAVVGVAQFSTQTFLIPRLKKRMNDTLLLLVGTAVRSVGFFLFAAFASIPIAAIACVFFAMGSGIYVPPLQTLATYTVAENARGGVLGYVQSATSLATIFSTAISGTIFVIDPTLPYWIGGAGTLLLLIPAFYLYRHPKVLEKQEERQEQPA